MEGQGVAVGTDVIAPVAVGGCVGVFADGWVEVLDDSAQPAEIAINTTDRRSG
jgi:hypothetical protein